MEGEEGSSDVRAKRNKQPNLAHAPLTNAHCTALVRLAKGLWSPAAPGLRISVRQTRSAVPSMHFVTAAGGKARARTERPMVAHSCAIYIAVNSKTQSNAQPTPTPTPLALATVTPPDSKPRGQGR